MKMQRKKCFPHLLLLLLGYSPSTPQPPLAPTPCTSSPSGLGLRRSSFTQGWAFRANGAFYAIFLIKNPQKLRGAVRPRRAPHGGGGARTGHWGGGGVAAAGPMCPSGAGPRVPGLWGGCGVVVGSHTTHQGQAGGLGGLHWSRWGWDPACRSSAPLTTAVPSPPCRAPLQRGTPGQGAQRVRAGVPSL